MPARGSCAGARACSRAGPEAEAEASLAAEDWGPGRGQLRLCRRSVRVRAWLPVPEVKTVLALFVLLSIIFLLLAGFCAAGWIEAIGRFDRLGVDLENVTIRRIEATARVLKLKIARAAKELSQ